MVSITLHPEAAAAIDRRAAHLLAALRTLTPEEKHASTRRFRPETHPWATVTEEDIVGPVEIERLNVVSGRVEFVTIETKKGIHTLDTELCNDLDELLSQIQKVTRISELVDRSYLRDVVKSWLREQHDGTTSEAFSDMLVTTITAAVKQLAVWIPIHGLYIQSPIQLGAVTLRAITSTKLAEWLEQFRKNVPPDQIADFDLHALELRHQLQGSAAAVVSLEAEPNYGSLHALELAEEATSLLRVFSLAALTPRVSSYCQPLGMEHKEQFEAYIEMGRDLQRIGRMLEPDPAPWHLSDDVAAELRTSGLDAVHQILVASPRSEFQERLLACLLIYSRAMTAKAPIEKLVFILVALESLLLKSDTESIQQSIGDRLAFVLGRNTEERRSIVKLTNRCYGFRSRYLHHGHDEQELDTIMEFMRYVWVFFTRLIRKHDSFPTKAELLEEIDRIKYS